MSPIAGHDAYLEPREVEREHLEGCPEHPKYQAEPEARIVCRCDIIEAGLADRSDFLFDEWRDRSLGI